MDALRAGASAARDFATRNLVVVIRDLERLDGRLIADALEQLTEEPSIPQPPLPLVFVVGATTSSSLGFSTRLDGQLFRLCDAARVMDTLVTRLFSSATGPEDAPSAGGSPADGASEQAGLGSRSDDPLVILRALFSATPPPEAELIGMLHRGAAELGPLGALRLSRSAYEYLVSVFQQRNRSVHSLVHSIELVLLDHYAGNPLSIFCPAPFNLHRLPAGPAADTAPGAPGPGSDLAWVDDALALATEYHWALIARLPSFQRFISSAAEAGILPRATLSASLPAPWDGLSGEPMPLAPPARALLRACLRSLHQFHVNLPNVGLRLLRTIEQAILGRATGGEAGTTGLRMLFFLSLRSELSHFGVVRGLMSSWEYVPGMLACIFAGMLPLTWAFFPWARGCHQQTAPINGTRDCRGCHLAH